MTFQGPRIGENIPYILKLPKEKMEHWFQNPAEKNTSIQEFYIYQTKIKM